jgi:hypothetical protein
MSPQIPTIPYDEIQELDVLVTYWMMFKHMISDFVHKEDLKAILAANAVSTVVTGGTVGVAPQPISGVGNGTATFPSGIDVAARSKNEAYKQAIKTGQAARKGAIDLVKGVVDGG